MELKQIECLLTAAEQCQNDESSLMLIVEQLERHVREHGSPELRYACAYAWYLHPRRLTDNRIWQRTDELLRELVGALPEDYLSLLYLGHNIYDRGSYSEAKSYFEMARQVAPKSYIGLKAYEMVVCCEIMSGGLGCALSAFSELVEEASKQTYASEDVWPRELAMALERVSSSIQVSAQQYEEAVQLAEHLDAAASLKWIGPLVRELKLNADSR